MNQMRHYALLSEEKVLSPIFVFRLGILYQKVLGFGAGHSSAAGGGEREREKKGNNDLWPLQISVYYEIDLRLTCVSQFVA